MIDVRTIRVVVLEDQRIVGESVARALVATGSITCEGVVASLAALGALLESRHAVDPLDVILADIDLGCGEYAFDVPRLVAGIGARVVFLSSHGQPSIVRLAVKSGAVGLVHKTEPMEKLVEAVFRAARGECTFAAADLAIARSAPPDPSKRECQVLRLMAQGFGNKEIAGQLRIKERTVESHMRRLLDRYGKANRTNLAVLALRQGWIDVGD